MYDSYFELIKFAAFNIRLTNVAQVGDCWMLAYIGQIN